MASTETPIKIALADDHKLFRQGMKLILSDTPGIEVVQEAENGKKLLAGLEASQPDVVLLDLEMPELSGKAALPILQKEYPKLRVLLLTMHRNEEYMVHFLRSGAHGYLLKDAEPEEVVLAIQKVHSTGLYMSDVVSRALLNQVDNPSPANVSGPEDELVERELEVLTLICKEHTTKEIADQLFLSSRTIESYRKRLLEKTGARNTAGLVKFALERGLFESNKP